jgi:putative copper resistance protein D
MSAPPLPSLPELLTGHWQFAWALNGELIVAGAVYVWSLRQLRSRWPWWRTASFLAGLLTLAVALESGIDNFDDRLLSVHMIQHLILLELAPVLLLGGRPVLLALRVLPAPGRRQLARVLAATRPFTTPVVCLALFTAVVLGTHVPALYDATLRHPVLHEAEHLAYLISGLLLWWPLAGGDPLPRRQLSGLAQLVYLIAAMLPMEAIGAWLNRDPSLVYSAYALPARQFGISAVFDQQQAGAIMWVAGGSLIVVLGLWSAVNALITEERRQQRRDARADLAGAGVPAPALSPDLATSREREAQGSAR